MADQVEYVAHPGADLFAAGCIILEAAAWVRNGEKGLNDFRRLRQVEIKEEAPELFERGDEDCFHNGSVLLRCVLEATSILSHDDNVTSRTLAIVLERVLSQGPDERTSAGDLRAQLNQAVLHGGHQTSASSPSRPPSSADGRSLGTWERKSATNQVVSPKLIDGNENWLSATTTRSQMRLGSNGQGEESVHTTSVPRKPRMHSHRKSLPHLSFDQVRDWRKSNKTLPLPGHSVAMKELEDRDHVSKPNASRCSLS